MFEVTNQPPPLDPYNLLLSDAGLRDAVAREVEAIVARAGPAA